MKKRVLFTILTFLISFLCLFSLVYSPQKIRKYEYNPNDVTAELTMKNVGQINAVEVSESGTYNVVDVDPYVVFPVESSNTRSVSLKIEKMDKNCVVHLYVDEGMGYYEEQKYVGVILAGEEYVCFEIEEPSITGLRFDIEESVVLDSVALHAGEADYTLIGYPVSAGLVVFAILGSVLIAVAAFFFYTKVDVIGHVVDFFRKNEKILGKCAIGLGVSFILAIPVEFIISRYILNMFSMGTRFNGYRYLFATCFIYVFIFLILMKDVITKKLETVVLGLILIIGITFIVTQPFGHAGWDVDSHYRMAQNSSYLGEAYITYADQSFFTCAYESLVKPNGVMNRGNIRYMNMAYDYVLEVQEGSVSLPHLPAGIFMAVARLLGASFHGIFLAGEFANLIIYALLCYFAIRKLKSGKMILAVFALFPTNFVIACNYSYDYWVTGFVMLGTAYFIGECQDVDQYISVKNTIIMCSAFALACIPKQIYVPLMILPFLMPRKKIKNKKLYYAICFGLIVLLFGSLLLRTAAETSVGGDVRGGSDVSVTGQLQYILDNKSAFGMTLINHLRSYLSFGFMHQMITNYANMGVTTWGSTIIMLVLIFVVVTDKKQCDRYASTWLIKSYCIAMYLGTAVLVSLAFYLVFTPVGADFVSGCQARYMFPALIPFLLVVGPHSTRSEMNPKLYSYGVLGTVLFIALMDNFIFTIGRMC